MADVSKIRHTTGSGDEVEIVTVTVRDLELTEKVMKHGHLIDMSGVVPVVTVEVVGRADQDLDETRVAEQVEAKVRKHPGDPARWTL